MDILQLIGRTAPLFEDDTSGRRKELEEWYVAHYNVWYYFSLIHLTMWVVFGLNSDLLWKLFKDLPPSEELDKWM